MWNIFNLFISYKTCMLKLCGKTLLRVDLIKLELHRLLYKLELHRIGYIVQACTTHIKIIESKKVCL